MRPASANADTAVDVHELAKRLKELESVVKKLGGGGK